MHILVQGFDPTECVYDKFIINPKISSTFDPKECVYDNFIINPRI